MSVDNSQRDEWGSRRNFLAAMLAQSLGPSTIILLPQQAVTFGAAGHILLYTAIYIFIGIPIVYMEYVTGQFTSRDCLEVWKARPCLSHVAYVQIFWQMMCIIFNLSFNSFVLHYFLISFEKPIPYYECGKWSTKECDILHRNYTIHQDCLSVQNRLPYCTQLCTTFPEYQYWRYHILGLGPYGHGFHLAWRVLLALGLICIALFLTCFRRIESIKLVMVYLAIFIIMARLLIFVGSMLQKGIVVKFEDAMDADFALFQNYFELPGCVVEVLFSLNVGTGISFNLASKSSFRSPTYSNTVIVVVMSAAVTIIGICSNLLMLCPYSFKYGVHPFDVVKYPIFVTYEMLPRLLQVYESTAFWLILCYSLIATSFFCTNTILMSCLLELLAKRNAMVARYPGMLTIAVVFVLFIFTIPLLGNKSFLFLVDLQRGINFLPIFTVTIECFVFLLSYGLGKFSEDVHFMLGVQPKAFVKVFWVASIFVLIYAFCIELYNIYLKRNISFGNVTGWWLLIGVITLTLLLCIGKISKALYEKKLHEVVSLDANWGPKSELLQRSRAMFTTHAMTKEYIYRQYHLQAGILMRQKRCNIRH